MQDYSPFDSFIGTTNRLPISETEARQLITFVKTNDKHGLTVRLHDAFAGDILGRFEQGIVLLTSPVLDSDFLFLKIDDGRGLFGGQKHRYLSGIGSYNRDAFMPGASFGNLAFALTSINNLFRAEGLCKGPVL